MTILGLEMARSLAASTVVAATEDWGAKLTGAAFLDPLKTPYPAEKHLENSLFRSGGSS